jgi:hypothetical protein
MPITINGSGTVTGISVGGLPDAIITGAELNGAQTGTAPIYGCRAWVVFNGTGTVSTNQAIRSSGNVASVFKNGTGDYTITFVAAMQDADYCVSFSTQTNPANGADCPSLHYNRTSNVQVAPTASTFRVSIINTAGLAVDRDYVCLTIFR